MTPEKAAEWAEFREFAKEQGLGDYTEALVRLCVPSVRLIAKNRAKARSRIGGLPDVPRGFTWPRSSTGEPLTFVAQLDLAELRATELPAAAALPARGSLAFFYGLEPAPSSEHMGNAGRVLYFEPGAPLSPAKPPEALEQLPSIPLRLALQDEQVPPIESPFYPVLLADARALQGDDPYSAASDVFADFVDAYGQLGVRDEGERPVHRVLGYADPLQADVYASCEGNAMKRPPSSWTSVDHLRAAARWCLLLQVDSDPDRNLCFGDEGVLAFMIREDDLAARRFDRVWVEWQSH